MCEQIDQLENDLKDYQTNFSDLVHGLMSDNVEQGESETKTIKLKETYTAMVKICEDMNFLDNSDIELLNSVKGYEALNKKAILKTQVLKQEIENIEGVLTNSLNKINEISEVDESNGQKEQNN